MAMALPRLGVKVCTLAPGGSDSVPGGMVGMARLFVPAGCEEALAIPDTLAASRIPIPINKASKASHVPGVGW
jgi:hypothetical protein